MAKKTFFLVLACFLLTVAYMSAGIYTGAEDVPTPQKSTTNLLPSIPVPSFPTNRFPGASLSFPTQRTYPGVPSGMTTPDWPEIPTQDFDWMNWWQINVSYMMKTHDESMFYREAQVSVEDIPSVLSLLDYKGTFYPITQKIAIRVLEKLETDGIDYLRKIARGEWDGKGTLHPTVSSQKLPGLAAYALGLIRADSAFNDIVALLESSGPEVRMLAVLALGHLGSEKSEKMIIGMLQGEKDQRVASAAMISLAMFGTETARKTLIEQIEKGPKNPVRQGFSYLALAMLMKRPSNADIIKAIFSSDCALWLAGLTARTAQLYAEDSTPGDVRKLLDLALMHCDGVSTLTALMPLYLLREKLELGDVKRLIENTDPEVRAFSRFLAAMSGSTELAKLVVGTEVDKDERAAKLQSLAVAYITAPDRASFARGLLNSEKDHIARLASMLALAEGMERADVSKLKAIASVAGGQEYETALLFTLYKGSPNYSGAWNELIRSLKSHNSYIKNLAMVLIGATNSSRAARLLIDLQSYEGNNLAFSIALSLLGPLPYELLLRNAIDAKGDIPRASAMLAFSFLPLESARATLLDRLDSESNPLARAHAAIGILQYKEDSLTPKQIEILIDASKRGADDWVRGYSTLALGKFAKYSEIAAALDEQLESSNVNIKAMAALSSGIYKYPRAQSILHELIEKERTYAVLAQITGFGMFKNPTMFPYFEGGIRVAANDPERLAFATALSASISPEDITTIVEKLNSVRTIDAKTYAWTLGLHDYPDSFLVRKVVNALRAIAPEKDETTRFHLALVRCALGDGEAANELLRVASSKGFYFDPILPEPRFLLEYFQADLPDYCKIVPYFFNN